MQHHLNLTQELRESSDSVERLRLQRALARFDPISSEDALLLETVQTCLAEFSRSLAERIEIRVLNGEVYLRGEVASVQEQRWLLQIVSHLPGVRDAHHFLHLPDRARFKNLKVRLSLLLSLLFGATCIAAIAGCCLKAYAAFPALRMQFAPA